MEILRTERLRLRWFNEADAPFMLALLNEPAWIANIADSGARDLQQAKAWMHERLTQRYWALGHGFRAVERLTDGELLGLCGVFKREGLQHPDLGYGFPKRHWGQGYAREAARACLRYAHEVLAMTCVQAITAVHNEASVRLLAALGLAEVGLTKLPGHDGDSRVFEWRATEPVLDDAAQIDALVARFFSVFGNRDAAIPTLAALPCQMLPGAIISRTDASGLAVMDVRGFIEPRAGLLTGGRLLEFSEWELEHQTRIHGAIAQRWLRYAKSGVLDGERFEGAGVKTLQLVKTLGGWRIAALAWQDDA